jgi:hypothetical protein
MHVCMVVCLFLCLCAPIRASVYTCVYAYVGLPRYNWGGLSLLFDCFLVLKREYTRKWLVVRTNHLAYYAAADADTPQEVLLWDRFTEVRRCFRFFRFSVSVSLCPAGCGMTGARVSLLSVRSGLGRVRVAAGGDGPARHGLVPRGACGQRLPRAGCPPAVRAPRAGAACAPAGRDDWCGSVCLHPCVQRRRAPDRRGQHQGPGVAHTHTARLRRCDRPRRPQHWWMVLRTLPRSPMRSRLPSTPSLSPGGGCRPR